MITRKQREQLREKLSEGFFADEIGGPFLGDDYYKAPYALIKKFIDTEAEELVKCDRCPRRSHHTNTYWFNDERGRHLLCSFCYREVCK